MHVYVAGVTFFALLCGLTLSSTTALAQQKSVTTAVAAPNAPKPFSISAGLSKSVSLIDHSDGTRQESNDLEVKPSYNFGSFQALALFGFSDDVRDPGNSELGDILVATSYKGWDVSRFNLSPSVTFVVPQSKESRVNNNLETAISTKLKVSVLEKYLLKGVSMSASASAGRNFHRYYTALDGKVLNQYSSKQGFAVGYKLGIFSFDVDFTHINAWSYEGNLKEFYAHSEEISVEIGKNFGFAVGLNNGPLGQPVFKEDGFSRNYEVIDENNTLAYATVSMQY